MSSSSLTASQGWFKQLFKLSPDPTWIIEGNRFVECNEAAIKTLGYASRDAFLNVHPAKLSPTLQFDGEDSFGKAERMMAIAKDRGLHRFEWLHTKADGSDFLAEVTLVAMELDERQIIYCVWRDITQRKQVEQALQESEEIFRHFMEHSPYYVFFKDQNIRALRLSRNYETLLGRPMAELLGKNMDELFPSPLAKSMVADDMKVLQEGRTIAVEEEFGGHYYATIKFPIVINAEPRYLAGYTVDVTEQKQAQDEIKRRVAQLQSSLMSTVEVATSLGELRDPYTAGHQRRVGKLAAAIGAELGLSEQQLEGLRVAGYLHDVGQITIPTEILARPGKLSALEYKLVQAHVQAGYEVLKSVEFPWPIAQVALQHHERMDGSGYPQGLQGEAILLEARIVAVADVIEAMSSHRPYRPSLGLDQALAEIEHGRGTLFDAAVVDACLNLFRSKGYAMPGY